MPQVKLFSIEQAEKALPLVRRIVADVVKSFDEREMRLLERKKLPSRLTPGSDAEARSFKLTQEIEHFEDEVRRFHEELQQIGVELKDVRMGLIDFFSRYEDRVVHLCWKLDEGDTLAWWHDLHSGFRGRQPITPSNRRRFKGLEPGQRFVEIK